MKYSSFWLGAFIMLVFGEVPEIDGAPGAAWISIAWEPKGKARAPGRAISTECQGGEKRETEV